MDHNNNPDDDSKNTLQMIKFKIINESPRTSSSIAMTTNNDFILEDNGICSQTTIDDKSAKISLAWHNLRYDIDGNIDDFGSKHHDHYRNSKKSFFSLKNFLLLHHRRGSIPSTPTTTPALNSSTSSSTISQQQKQSSPILRRLTGYFQYHTVNGLLGPSEHARKTLIKCLTGSLRYPGGFSKDSEIYINESQSKRPGCIGWIPKNLNDKITFKQMSIGELLRYSFLFNNGFRSWFRYRQHINTIFTEMSPMIDYRKILGKKLSQCSGCEQRLVAIAQEFMYLSTVPTFLFLDEPFFNLDMSSSQTIMHSLRKLSRKYSLTVTISAQTPDTHLISLFDKLYILAHGGVCIYSGPPQLLSQTLKEELNIYQIPSNGQENGNYSNKRPPIEEMLKISCFEFTNAKVRKLADQTLLEEHQRLSLHLNQLQFQPNGIMIPGKCFQPSDLFLQTFRQFRLLFLNRWFPLKLFSTILYYAFLAFFLVNNDNNHKVISANRCYDSESQRLIVPSNQTCQQIVQEQFLMDFYVTYQMYSMWFLASWSITTTAIFYSQMLQLFQDEHQNRRFSLGVFVTSSALVQLIDSIFWSLICTALMYYLVDHSAVEKQQLEFSGFLFFGNLERFLHFLLLYWLLAIYHQSYGMLLSVIMLYSSTTCSSILLISLSQVIVLLFQLLNNNMLVIVERINSWFLRSIGTHFISIRAIYDGVIYTFYGLSRSCDHHFNHSQYHHNLYPSTRYFSSIFRRYSIPFDREQIYWNLIPIVIIVMMIRLIAFFILWFRFRFKLHYFATKKKSANTSRKPTEIIPIDYGPKDGQRKKAKVRIIQPIFKDDDEVEFCRDKIHLAWRSLSLFACKKSLIKRDSSSNFILHNLNGQFRLGTMNAVIGGSNSCDDGHIRTLLLRVFSGQLKTRLSIETKFYESQYATTNVCFISRRAREHLISGLTSKQSLIYASMVKNIDEDYFSAVAGHRLDHEEMALNILDELDLGHRAESFVEDCTESEQKRLSLALELTSLQMPNLICMDEPTEGLDVITAEQLVQCMRQLSDRHSITFVVSFHQINHQMLSQFDQLYCLSQNGTCIYSGPPTGASIRQHLGEIVNSTENDTEKAKSLSPLLPLEELLRYSCMDMVPALKKLMERNDQEILKADKLLPGDTVSLGPKGIKSNVARFSIVSALRLSRRYHGRWKSSLWFQWILYTSLYLTFGLLLNGLFGSDIGRPDGCIRKDIYNGTSNCPQYRTGTKMIWEEDSELLWDNYRYIHLANHLFLMVCLFQTAMFFYQELKVFLIEHQNGWFSTGVFYLIHDLLIDLIPMIPITMIYLYLIDFDHPQQPHGERENVETESSFIVKTYYWWSVVLTLIATKSIQSLSHLVVIIFGNHCIRSEIILVVLLAIFAFLNITSNFQILTNFTLSFLNVFHYLNEATFILHYGFFRRCSTPASSLSAHKKEQQQLISLVLTRIGITDGGINSTSHFYHCLRVLIYQTLLFRLMSWFALLIRSNCDRIFHHHRLWMTGDKTNSSSSHQDYEWTHYHQQQQQPETSSPSSTPASIFLEDNSNSDLGGPSMFSTP